MSANFGKMGRGAARRLREVKRTEAETRNAATKPENRRAFRRPCPILQANGKPKEKYATEHDARAELVGALVAKNMGRNQRHETRAYECPACHGWHLTSAPERRAS